MKASGPLLLCVSLLPLLSGCGPSDPFSYVQISGKITYEDGTLIPVRHLELTFVPQSAPLDAKTYPRPGVAVVDTATGEFHAVTSHRYNDGLVRGKHKVVLGGVSSFPLPPSLVPPEYCDFTKTPLEVDTAQQPFVLKVRKPG
jgi:hypothetical protein